MVRWPLTWLAMRLRAASAAADAGALGTFRDAVKGEENLLILIGSELRGADLKKLIEFGLTLPGAKFALLSDYVNSRGAADMGLLPDMLPGYTPIGSSAFERVRCSRRSRASTCWRSSTRLGVASFLRCMWLGRIRLHATVSILLR